MPGLYCKLNMATINHVPEEILLEIVEYVYLTTADTSNGLPRLGLYNQAEKIANTKSLRLTCRKLCRLTTRPLFTAVSCSILDHSSLKRLEHISRYPHLSEHVKTVHFKLGFYDPILAQDLEGLAKYLLWAWEDFKQPAPGDKAGWEVDETTEEVAMRRTLEEWIYLSQNGNRRDRERLLPALLKIQAEYRRRYMVQQNLRKGGSAIRRAGEAMARMPAATSLILQDARQAHAHLGPTLPSTLNSAVDLSTLPLSLSWTDSARLKEERCLCEFTPPFDLIIDIPVAMHRAGVVLTELRILGMPIPDEVPAWDAIDPYGWERHPTNAAALDLTNEIQLSTASDLAEACSQLQVFQYDPQTELVVKDEVQTFLYMFDDTLSRLSKIMEQMCMSTHMRRLHLDCLCLDYGSPSDTEIHYFEAVFASASWPNLESLHIVNGRLESGSTLLNLVRDLPRLSHLELDTLGLDFYHAEGALEASWSHLLDELKKEVRRLQRNGLRQSGREPVLPIRIRNPEAFLHQHPVD
ncbi:hypothetical protein MCOR27_005170 [Pyricularia oryzae]|uniref:F-box domain-containing protein n=1 Tax=Pyricularia grisea TaxID=148305 RepID=A0ABQ8NNA3_PYRGI|nr:hypothetical protein MCOR01_000675 [Pyricularia oryzae]KAI6299731.1 hypothetical protein MCOR33_004432 [Pyricularia grisea]KAI6279412.1 hypothetical protein MCOR27_005170 [Pyricularia oryzae]KAI6315268.1 hypothetical protein MCOR29_007020 [Pyricularia oryzae]KAI6345214.1 hypothetical protein MCOR30_000935 [Pyricularia oryzae]